MKEKQNFARTIIGTFLFDRKSIDFVEKLSGVSASVIFMYRIDTIRNFLILDETYKRFRHSSLNVVESFLLFPWMPLVVSMTVFMTRLITTFLF